jgi:hypothetical protein
MPKFEKGSEAAKEYMKMLREKRAAKPKEERKPKEKKHKISKDKVQEIVKDAIDKYFLTGTATITVPDKVVKIDTKGHPKLIDTLTQSGNLKTVNGDKVINLESDKEVKNIVVSDVGTRLKDKSNLLQTEILERKAISEYQEKKKLFNELSRLRRHLKTNIPEEEKDKMKAKITDIRNLLQEKNKSQEELNYIKQQHYNETTEAVNAYKKALNKK